MLKNFVLIALVVLSSQFTLAYDAFPKGPIADLTPGALCQRASTYRYPEHIPYCERDVSRSTKEQIFEKYDQLGFNTQGMDRREFKIDHYIPLCAGGSNHSRNLWPQHESVYTITDPLEALVCEKMAAGRLSQKKAVSYIIEAKNNLSEVPSIISEVNSL